MSKLQAFYAVRVILKDADGQTYTRDYVRGEMRLGIDKFDSFALGDMIRTVGQPALREIEITQIDFLTVQENRQYQHTTHNEAGESN